MTTTAAASHLPDTDIDVEENSLEPLVARPKCSNTIFEELGKFRISLKWCALDHSSWHGKLISYSAFLLLAVLIPILTAVSTFDPFSFNKLVQLPESGLAAIAFFTLSRFFKTYGLRQLLFLDGLGADCPLVRRGYARELDKAFRYLACVLFPSLFVELAHKVVFFSAAKISLPCVTVGPGFPLSSVAFFLVVASWVYRTGVFLLVCVLFRLTCELQILRFEGLHELFEGCDSDSSAIFEEHVRIRKQLLVTSHRYRVFIIACLFTITVSQFATLLMVLASKSDKNFFNSGDLLVCSAVELCGFCMCLLGAARITHRAQRIVGIATRWHMLVTAGSKSQPHSDPDDHDSSRYSDSLSSPMHHPSSFHTRQALVGYLQHNNGGITVFGFALDRGLLHTLFAFEFSLVLWILSKVVVLS